MNYVKIITVLESPITLLDFLILENVSSNNEVNFLKDERFKGHIENLKQGGYLSDNTKLTVKAKELIDAVAKAQVDNFFTNLYRKLQEKMVQVTGKKQKLLQNKYGFIPNEKDLTMRLQKVIKKYSLNDKDKIEQVLLSYIDKCNRARFEYTQTVAYYILKDDSSNFVTDYENFIAGEEEVEIDNAVNL